VAFPPHARLLARSTPYSRAWAHFGYRSFTTKLVTALQRGTANTRWRDFADIYLLAARHAIPGDELQSAITRVAAHRRAGLLPLREILDGYPAIAQPRWAAWRRGQRLDDRPPSQFTDVLDHVIIFADPVLTGTAGDAT
jgi:hypothetical protein